MSKAKFIEGYLNDLYLSGKRPNLKPPVMKQVVVPKGYTMTVKTCFNFK